MAVPGASRALQERLVSGSWATSALCDRYGGRRSTSAPAWPRGPDDHRRDRTWYRACPARAPAEGGGAAQAAVGAPAVVPDAAHAGRPHPRHALHTVTAVLVRHGAQEARQLVSACGCEGRTVGAAPAYDQKGHSE
ncbi:hypothetical protein GCM10010512_11520 [Streptomyces thermoviolaceus subsp. thermoviolaceus]|nr:hypothetical protein GCM10010499_14610 [Streptomyces thermoviolaceus subsp. apingens]GHA81700.1 hypothetical protein GCM10010512_11520 [Streptomyces thermoviolaceus subsp. thermoviolaceus]